MTTGPNTGKNRKKVLIVGRMPQAGIDVLKTRDDVDYEILADDTVPSLHPKLKDANAVTLGATPFRQAELDAAPGMMVVARLGVGFDAVEIPALNKRKIPLMTTGIANSVSVAEHAMYMLLAAARLTKKSDRWVRTGAWGERLERPAVRRRGQEGPGGRHGPHRLAHGEALRRLRDGDLRARSQRVEGRHREGRRHQGHRSQGDPAAGRLSCRSTARRRRRRSTCSTPRRWR